MSSNEQEIYFTQEIALWNKTETEWVKASLLATVSLREDERTGMTTVKGWYKPWPKNSESERMKYFNFGTFTKRSEAKEFADSLAKEIRCQMVQQ